MGKITLCLHLLNVRHHFTLLRTCLQFIRFHPFAEIKISTLLGIANVHRFVPPEQIAAKPLSPSTVLATRHVA